MISNNWGTDEAMVQVYTEIVQGLCTNLRRLLYGTSWHPWKRGQSSFHIWNWNLPAPGTPKSRRGHGSAQQQRRQGQDCTGASLFALPSAAGPRATQLQTPPRCSRRWPWLVFILQQKQQDYRSGLQRCPSMGRHSGCGDTLEWSGNLESRLPSPWESWGSSVITTITWFR